MEGFAMPAPSLYLKQKTAIKDLAELGFPPISHTTVFVGIDLAPSESLETGIAILDTERNLLRMDKLGVDDDIVQYIQNLQPYTGTLIMIDQPKNLSVENRWRQEQIRMHPLQIYRDGGSPEDRFSERAMTLYDAIRDNENRLVFLHYNHLAKMRYNLQIPFRTRTPHGCRALQATIKTVLEIPNMPTNLAPISVLDAMIGAYSAWLMRYGSDETHFQLYKDEDKRLHYEPLARLMPAVKSRR
jgi:hypothetical protein